MSERFHLVSEWHLSAPPEAVWEVLAATEDWPDWWTYVRKVELLRAGADSGEGAVRRIRWGSALPYGLTLEVTTRVAEKPQLMVGEASGDLTGLGRWELAAIPVGTRVRYTWDVVLERSWMRACAPFLAPVFAWNHHRVMRAGAAGMARRLGAELIDYHRRQRKEAVDETTD